MDFIIIKIHNNLIRFIGTRPFWMWLVRWRPKQNLIMAASVDDEDSSIDSPGMHVIQNCSPMISETDLNLLSVAELLHEKELITEEEKREIIECECKEDQLSVLLNTVSNCIQKKEIAFHKFVGIVLFHDRELGRKLLEEYKSMAKKYSVLSIFWGIFAF